MLNKKEGYFEDDQVRAWTEDGLIFFEYKEGAIVDLAVQIRHIENRIRITGSCPKPMLTDSTRAQYWTAEARKFAVANFQGITATAFIINGTVVHRIMINFFTRFMKIPIPFRAFTEKKQALIWLEQFKKSNKHNELKTLKYQKK